MLLISSVVAQSADMTAPFLGDWQDKSGKLFAQVYVAKDRIYNANLITDLTSRASPVAVLHGEKGNENVLRMSGDGWKGGLEEGKLVISNGTESLEMQPFYRSSPTTNAPPPNGAIVLFDGTNLNAWTKVMEKDWLVGGVPADNWKIIPEGVLEVVPHEAGLYESIISKQKFGDLKMHLEFRLLGEATNGGGYFRKTSQE